MAPRKFGTLFLVAALTLLALTPLSAQLLTSSDLNETPDGSGNVNLAAFNSNLGTLAIVILSYDISLGGGVGLYNPSNATATYSGSINATNQLTSTDADFSQSFQVTLNVSATVDSMQGTGATGSGSNHNGFNIDPSEFSHWEAPGGGTLTFNFAPGSASATPSGNAIQVSAPSLVQTPRFSVYYVYSQGATAAPEPSAFDLTALVIALLGMTGLFRHFRAAS